MSAAIWVKIISFRQGYNGIFCCSDGTGWVNGRFGFTQNGGKNICAEVGGSYKNMCTVELNKWYHMCLTFANKKAIFYLNGQKVNELTTSGDLNLSTINMAALGTWNNSYTGNMKVMDFRVWNHELTPEEVALAMNGDLYCHYPLNGVPHDTADVEYDISGNNNNIIGSTNLAAFIANDNPIRYANYYNFNGSRYLKKTDFTYAGNIWSASIWYYATGLASGYNCIMCLSSNDGGDGYKKMCAGPHTNGNIWCKIENQSISSGASLIQNAWTHLVLTSDGTTGKVYQNGVQTSSVTLSGTISGATCLGIGCRQGNADFTSIGAPWHGNLSDFRFYTKCLTADEVTELYNMGKVN